MREIEIRWLLPDGRGGGRDDRGIVRLEDALPGDVVLTDGDRVIERRVPSPDRRAPDCPHADRCGGCDLAAYRPTARIEALRRTAARALALDAPPDWVPSPRATAHRARIKLAIDGGRVGYRAARSHELVEIATCGVAREEVRAALDRLRDHGVPDGVEAVEIRSDGARAVYAFTSSGRVDPGVLEGLGDVALDGRPVAGNPTLTLHVAGLALRASPRSFYQVNLEVNEALVGYVREVVLALAPERVLDLYCGIGNLSLPLADAGVPVTAVELEGQAIADLRASAGGRPVEAVAAAVERFDPTRTAFDVAVLDPPRAGAPGVLARLVRQRPRALVYVSCHLPSAVRDLKEARRAGYELVAARGFDMFPDTHHFETVLVLRRGKTRGR